MTTVLDLAAVGCLVVAAYLVALPLALAVLGLSMLAASATLTRKEAGDG